jgi:hypothetical protein
MSCDCVHRTVQNIIQECKSLTWQAQNAYQQGKLETAGDYFMRAFETSRKLLGSPALSPTGVCCFVDACFNCADYCRDGRGGPNLQPLQISADALRCIVASPAYGKEVRVTALDCCISVSMSLVNALNRQHELLAADDIANRFESVWCSYSRDLLQQH